jgi:glyoxylase-like metal-dependent hydrolase (beta-lactamase superfamily II)
MKIHTLDHHFQGNSDTIASFLVASDQALTLVETGAYSTFHILKKAIEDLGFELKNIKSVLLSHIHLDHAGAAWAFARQGATIYVHPFGAAHLENPEKLMASAKMIYQDQMESLWGKMEAIPKNQLVEVLDGQEFSFGDQVWKGWHTAGHANHHLAWQLGQDLFAGDVAGVQIGKGAVVAPCPPPDIDLEKWVKSIELMRNLPIKSLYLTHYGKKTNISEHLNELESNLFVFANWVKNRMKTEDSLEKIIADFEEFSRQKLISLGLNEAELLQYRYANPAFMSVTGLIRYWKKKEIKI